MKNENQVNLCDRTLQQQEDIESKTMKSGSLWPKFDVLHKFIFTSEELEEVKMAKFIIEKHKNKLKINNLTDTIKI